MQNAPWLEKALSYLGQQEVAGLQNNNQFILDCFKFTTYEAPNDETPWCAAFICRCLEESGYKSTKSAAAKSYIDFGILSPLQEGAIAVFTWASGEHHVTIVKDILVEQNLIGCVGGNQHDRVKVSYYDKKFLTALRWPDQQLTEGKNV